MKKLVVVELFAGTRSVSRAFEEHGHKTFCVDWNRDFPDIDLYADISTLEAKTLLDAVGGHIDVLWLSPDCTSYSVSAIGKHRKKNPITKSLDPISEYAKFCDETNKHCLQLIKELNPTYWFIENPRGGMRKMDFMQNLPRYTVTYCFSGDTKIITDTGHYSLFELCGKTVNILNRFGDWESAVVREYGKDILYKITLSRCKKQKVIYATANHKWWATKAGCHKLNEYITTDLKKGMYLPYSIPKKQEVTIIPEYVCRGFVFGDGWVLSNKTHAFCQFVNEKQEMLKYFEEFGGKRWKDNKGSLDIIKMYSLPKKWKLEIPNVTDDPSHIFSWLAGYIAADGSCSRTNGQLTLSSSKKEDLLKVRELAEAIGIGTYPIIEHERLGYGKEKTKIYQVTFMRQDVSDSLLLRNKHKVAFVNHKNTKYQSRSWNIVSVEPTDRVETVYCCETSTTNSFTLEDNIVTHNCQYTKELPLEQRRMKPTDIWTNHPNPKFKPPCKNGDHCHVPAPRGSRTGTQGLANAKERARIPVELCRHIVDICENPEDDTIKNIENTQISISDFLLKGLN